MYAQLTPLAPQAAPLERIEAIHTPEYVRRVRTSCETGEEYLDSPDVPISRKSYAAAVWRRWSAPAVDAVMQGEVTNAFCAVDRRVIMRRRDRAMGFCIFNNVAIAARYVQQQHGWRRSSSSTGTSTTATARRQPSTTIPTCCTSACISGLSIRAPAAPRRRAAARV